MPSKIIKFNYKNKQLCISCICACVVILMTSQANHCCHRLKELFVMKFKVCFDDFQKMLKNSFRSYNIICETSRIPLKY